MFPGYAYALVIDGEPIKPWFTGKDGALREVNLERFVAQYPGTKVAHIIDQRIGKIVVVYPAPRTIYA